MCEARSCGAGAMRARAGAAMGAPPRPVLCSQGGPPPPPCGRQQLAAQSDRDRPRPRPGATGEPACNQFHPVTGLYVVRLRRAPSAIIPPPFSFI
jgi:hypothetical protein